MKVVYVRGPFKVIQFSDKFREKKGHDLKEYLVVNMAIPKDGKRKGHAHLDSLAMAKRLIWLARKGRVDRSLDDYHLRSLYRITKDRLQMARIRRILQSRTSEGGAKKTHELPQVSSGS